jgi:hypothetical protein
MAKYEITIPQQATPEFLIDELGRMSVAENYLKKKRKMYRAALLAKLDINEDEAKTRKIEPSFHEGGELFDIQIDPSESSRLDITRLKEEKPDIYTEYLKDSLGIRALMKLKQGVINPKAEAILEELYMELDLELKGFSPEE